MTAPELIKFILSLPNDQKKLIRDMLNELTNENYGEIYNLDTLTKTPEWLEVIRRSEEIMVEEKSCLIHFDDHIQSFN